MSDQYLKAFKIFGKDGNYIGCVHAKDEKSAKAKSNFKYGKTFSHVEPLAKTRSKGE